MHLGELNRNSDRSEFHRNVCEFFKSFCSARLFCDVGGSAEVFLVEQNFGIDGIQGRTRPKVGRSTTHFGPLSIHEALADGELQEAWKS